MAESVRQSIGLARQTVARVVREFLTDETGQDLVEYALLTATIGLSSAAVWLAIGPTIRTAYSRWGTDIYNSWNSPDPNP